MAYKFTRDDCSRGGKAASSLPGFRSIQIRGYESTVSRYGRDAAKAIMRRTARGRSVVVTVGSSSFVLGEYRVGGSR